MNKIKGTQGAEYATADCVVDHHINGDNKHKQEPAPKGWIRKKGHCFSDCRGIELDGKRRRFCSKEQAIPKG